MRNKDIIDIEKLNLFWILCQIEGGKDKKNGGGESFIGTAVTDLRYPCFAPWALFAAFVWGKKGTNWLGGRREILT